MSNGVKIIGVTSAGAEVNVAVDSNGNILTSSLETDGLETLIMAMSAKLPASLGIKTAANSLSIAFASDSVLPEPATTARTPSYTRVTDATNIAAGAQSVTISNVGIAAGTVLTTTLNPGETVNFNANRGDTLAAIAYVATGTTFAIVKVT